MRVRFKDVGDKKMYRLERVEDWVWEWVCWGLGL